MMRGFSLISYNYDAFGRFTSPMATLYVAI